MFTQDDDDSFKTMIDVAYKVTSKHLMEVLYTKYNFINHLKVTYTRYTKYNKYINIKYICVLITRYNLVYHHK